MSVERLQIRFSHLRESGLWNWQHNSTGLVGIASSAQGARHGGRIKHILNIIRSAWIDGRESAQKISIEGGIVRYHWISKYKALIGVVPQHESKAVVVGVLKKQFSWDRWGEQAIYHRPKRIVSVGWVCHLNNIGLDQGAWRKLPSFFYRTNVKQREESIKCCLLLKITGDVLKSRALQNTLLEWYGTLEAPERRNLMHDRSTSSRLANHGDTVWVTAECMNVVLNPLQSKTLIVQTSVSCPITLESWARQPSKGTQTIIERDEDYSFSTIDLACLNQACGAWNTIS